MHRTGFFIPITHPLRRLANGGGSIYQALFPRAKTSFHMGF